MRGEPFVGDAGKVLNAALDGAGVSRSVILITNIVDKRPPRDDWGAHSVEAITFGTTRLCELLNGAPRRTVVGLGAQAFYACATGEPPPRSERELTAALAARFGGSITELRGYVWDGPFGPTMAAVHPAFVLRTWLPWRATLQWDLEKAARWVRGCGPPQRVSRFCRNSSEAAAAAVSFLRAPLLACDIETDGGCAPVCVAFAASADEGVTFVLPRDRAQVAELLASPADKIFQNGQFDVTVLRRHDFEVRNFAHDVMLLWHAVEPLIAGRSGDTGSRASQKSLRFLASVFTDEPFWKDYHFEREEDRWTLNATDARVTYEVFERLQKPLHGCSKAKIVVI